MDNWAEKITTLEAEKGRTLTALADEIGLSVQALSDIKQGRSKAPTGMAAVNLHRLYLAAVKRRDRAAAA
jgi:transcriptional regulator with XRE-family HTH domain